MFETRVITSPGDVADEAAKLAVLLDAGVDYVHVRKPSWSLPEVRRLIEEMPYRLRKRVILHGHFELLNDMNLGGVSLNRRNPHAPSTALVTGVSCHSVEEARENASRDFILLSPVYPSISKPGYAPGEDLLHSTDSLRGIKAIALGGVRPENFAELREAGFFGAALLGYVWGNEFDTAVSSIASGIKKIT